MSRDWLTTTTLLDGLRDYDNRDAWDRFVRRFRTPVVAFAARYGVPPADAEDVAQDVLITFAERFRAGHYDRRRGRLSTWLFGIAFNHVMRCRRGLARQADRRAGIPADLAYEQVDEDSGKAVWEEEWNAALWKLCAQRVQHEFEATTYRAFERVVRDDAAPADVARELGIPIRSVYNARYRVLKRLRELRTELEEVC